MTSSIEKQLLDNKPKGWRLVRVSAIPSSFGFKATHEATFKNKRLNIETTIYFNVFGGEVLELSKLKGALKHYSDQKCIEFSEAL